MKSWIRTRLAYPDSGSRDPKRRTPSTSFYSYKSDHAWSGPHDSSGPSEVCPSKGFQSKNAQNPDKEEDRFPKSYAHHPDSMTTLTPRSESTSTLIQAKEDRTPDLELLDQLSHLLSPVDGSGLVRKHILMSSEHYFRLALESYEQLKAAHYRASQEFSLAEWLHIHALLLYGRIQHVRKAAQAGSISPHNQVDLSRDVAVFTPIATALNAIGTVEDQESGVAYIPDAVFPTDSYTSTPSERIYEYSTQEMQQILRGTLYDWQRSWHRVLEAREERSSRATKYSMVRSSSQLISAIRDVTESIAKIQERALSPTMESDELADQTSDHDYRLKEEVTLPNSASMGIAGREKKLVQLMEEARDTKDYTLRPPCSRLYGLESSATTMNSQPFAQRNREIFVDSASLYRSSETSETIAEVRKRDEEVHLRYLQQQGTSLRSEAPDRPLEAKSASTDPQLELGSAPASMGFEPKELQKKLMMLTLGSEESEIGDETIGKHTLDPKRQTPQNALTLESNSCSHSRLTPFSQQTLIDSSPLSSSDVKDTERRGTPRAETDVITKANLPRQPPFLVPPIRTARPTDANASPPPRSAMRKAVRSRESHESPPDSLMSSSTDISPANTDSSKSTWGSISSLVKPRVKIGGSSSVGCFVNYDSRLWQDYEKFVGALQQRNLAQFSRLKESPKGNYAWMLPVKVSHGSNDWAPQLVLPRASIPAADQMLALILQTSHASPKLLESWNHSVVARIDLRQMLASYVETAITSI